jgi:acyl-CoA dehydrogenase
MTHPIFTEDHDLIRAQLRRFVEEKVKLDGPKWEEAGFVPREILREMGGLGFFSLRVPEALGGSGLDARASVVLAEEVGRSTHGGFAITVLVHTDMASPHLIRFGSRRQLEKYLPGVMAGTTITAVGVTEPSAGSDVAAIRTRAERDGEHYVLNGAKMFITNGVHGDLYFVAARSDREGQGQPCHYHLHRREGHAGLQGRPRPRQDGWRSRIRPN